MTSVSWTDCSAQLVRGSDDNTDEPVGAMKSVKSGGDDGGFGRVRFAEGNV